VTMLPNMRVQRTSPCGLAADALSLDRVKIACSILFAVSLACIRSVSAADTVATFTLPSGVSIQIVEARFDRAKNPVHGCTGMSHECLINGRVPFGCDNDVPATYVKSITASFKGKSYALESSQMFNAWGERPLSVPGQVRYFGGSCRDSESCVFRGLFADGAGTFVAEWQVVFGVPVRTVITWSNDVITLFKEDIDASESEDE